MTFQSIKKFFNNPKVDTTRLSTDYALNNYGDKVEIKHSVKWNLLTLVAMLILSAYLLSNISTHSNKLLTIIFCLIIVIYPSIKLFNQNPLLTVSATGILFKDGLFWKWTEITSTKIEEMDSDSLMYRLHITCKDETKITSLTDLNYSKDEISHLIEYYKNKAS